MSDYPRLAYTIPKEESMREMLLNTLLGLTAPLFLAVAKKKATKKAAPKKKAATKKAAPKKKAALIRRRAPKPAPQPAPQPQPAEPAPQPLTQPIPEQPPAQQGTGEG